VKVRGLIDTGSEVTLLSEKLFRQIPVRTKLKRTNINLQSVSGSSLKVIGSSHINFTLGKQKLTHEFIIVKDINRNCILGRDFFNRFSARIYFDLKRIRINGEYIPIENDIHIASLVRTCRTITIKPYTTVTTMGKVKRNSTLSEGKYDLHLISDCINDQPGFYLMDSLVTVTDNRRFPLCLVNTTGQTLRLCKDTIVGKLDRLFEVNSTFRQNKDDTSVEDGSRDLEFTCNPKYTHFIKPVLERNRDLFAKSDKDLTPTTAIKAHY
jgi:hypothetical protein